MCFSAEASFTASAVLAGVGYFTLKTPKPRNLQLLAAVPLLFAIQQFSEGFLWLYFSQVLTHPYVRVVAEHVYMFFAYLFWPIVFPLAILIPEKIHVRRIGIGLVLALGTVWTLSMLYLYPESVFSAHIAGQSIQYVGESDFVRKVVYGSVIILPCFISSLRGMTILGSFILASYIVSEIFYQYVFTSVWCFFAALISTGLYILIKSNCSEENNNKIDSHKTNEGV